MRYPIKTLFIALIFFCLLAGCGGPKKSVNPANKLTIFADLKDLPPFKTNSLKGQIYDETGVRRIRFPDVLAQHLSPDIIYVLEVGVSSETDEKKLQKLPFDYVMNNDRPVNYFGYKYTSTDAAREIKMAGNQSFKARFPGQFFASAKAHTDDAALGGGLRKFMQETGITFLPTDASENAVRFSTGSLYVVIINEPLGFIIDTQPKGYCGDGWKTGTEACDDGVLNGGNHDKCDFDCKLRCGNGFLDQDPGEKCDHGSLNGTAADKCSSVCLLRCGNGIPEPGPGEECDDGTLNGTAKDKCAVDCKLRCGNGILEPDAGEECDNGVLNDSSLDLCSTDCKYRCGNGIVESDPGEECDDDNSTPGDGCGNCLVENGWLCSGEPSVCVPEESSSSEGQSSSDTSSSEDQSSSSISSSDEQSSSQDSSETQTYCCNGDTNTCYAGAGCPYDTVDSCNVACTIQTQTRYCCATDYCYVGGSECPYTSFNQCDTACRQSQSFCCISGSCINLPAGECPFTSFSQCAANCGGTYYFCCYGTSDSPYCGVGSTSCPYHSIDECAAACLPQ